MTLYTTMPLELVLDGIGNEPGPFLELTLDGVTMQVRPAGPGVGTIERLLHAPLDRYLSPDYAPGRTVYYAAQPPDVSDAGQTGLGI